MTLPEKRWPPQKMTYQGYQINLYPYAGGFKSYVFPPGEFQALKSSPILVGPDGQEDIIEDQIIRVSKLLVDEDLARKSA